ncbi:MAG: PIN domain-containing protein [Verrucomicrobiae bacterium]|nr:PIN domain-containing protein [Verrucomicrobiae bacterium]
MGLIVDSSAIIELERSGGDLGKLLKKHGDEEISLPAIVWGELCAGVHLADSVPRALKRRQLLDRIRSGVEIIEFDEVIADIWAELFADLQRRGEPVPANDLCVAATALALDHPLLIGSRGERHFKKINGLNLIKVG